MRFEVLFHLVSSRQRSLRNVEVDYSADRNLTTSNATKNCYLVKQIKKLDYRNYNWNDLNVDSYEISGPFDDAKQARSELKKWKMKKGWGKMVHCLASETNLAKMSSRSNVCTEQCGNALVDPYLVSDGISTQKSWLTERKREYRPYWRNDNHIGHMAQALFDQVVNVKWKWDLTSCPWSDPTQRCFDQLSATYIKNSECSHVPQTDESMTCPVTQDCYAASLYNDELKYEENADAAQARNDLSRMAVEAKDAFRVVLCTAASNPELPTMPDHAYWVDPHSVTDGIQRQKSPQNLKSRHFNTKWNNWYDIFAIAKKLRKALADDKVLPS